MAHSKRGSLQDFRDSIQFRALISTIIMEWANLESLFSWMTTILLKTDPYRGETVFYSYYSTAARMELVARLTHMFVRNAKVRGEILGILKRFKKLTETRNELAHCVYSNPDSGDGPFIDVKLITSVRFPNQFDGTGYVRFRKIDRAAMNEFEQAQKLGVTLNLEVRALMEKLPRYVKGLPPEPRHMHPEHMHPKARPAHRNKRP
jgi:hypothetical protein